MKRLTLALLALSLFVLASIFLLRAPHAINEAAAQTRERRTETTTPVRADEVVKIDVDLVVLDALVMQRKTGRVVGDLRREDFTLYEDGVAQEIKHFSQDALPLSVILLIDRGGCLDPFGSEVRRATREALKRLKPTDEVAVMTYADSAELIEGFSRDRERTLDAIDRVPPHEEEAGHCLNLGFHEAAEYMMKAGNPSGRRVIIVVTAVKSGFDCGEPSGKEARLSIFESGSVVCGLVPKTKLQRMENGVARMGTSLGRLFKLPVISIDKLAEETGGEIMDDDAPETMDRAFSTLMEHLRTRYNMGFVSTNKTSDGGMRKLKLKLSKETEKAAAKSGDKLVIKTRTTYLAPKRPAIRQAPADSGGVK